MKALIIWKILSKYETLETKYADIDISQISPKKRGAFFGIFFLNSVFFGLYLRKGIR